MNFERGIDIKKVLNIGVLEKLPKWMEESGFNYENYYDVWRWGRQEEKSFVFTLIVGMRGKKWYDGETVIVGMDDNNALLWESVSENCFPAVKAILEVPGLFSKEVLKMDYGTSSLKETFMREDLERNYRATNFGQFLYVAMTKAEGKFELQDALRDYYKKEKNDSV